MTAEIARVLAVLIVEVGGGAALGFLLLRRGIGNVRRGFKLRHLPLLDGIDTNALKASTTSAWPVGGRWPTPSQHQDHLNDEDLRAAYARLARAKAQAMSVGSEVVLLSAFALLSFSLPADMSDSRRYTSHRSAPTATGPSFPGMHLCSTARPCGEASCCSSSLPSP